MIPELLVKSGSFARPTVTGLHEVTGIGFRPKLIIFIGTNQSAAGNGAEVRFSYGFAEAFAFTQVVGQFALSTVAANFTSKSLDEDYCYGIYENVGGSYDVEGLASLVDVSDDSFTLNFLAANTDAPLIDYIALGGEAITAAACGLYVPRTATGNQDVPVGFSPDMIFHLAANPENGGATQELCFSTAFGRGESGAVSSMMMTSVADDASTPTNTNRHFRANQLFSVVNTNTNAVQRLGSYAGQVGLGFRVSHQTVSAIADIFAFCAVKGLQAQMSTANQPTSLGNQSVTGLTYQPKLIMFQSAVNTNFLAVQAHFRAMRGWYDGTNQRSYFQGSTDNVNPPVNREDYSQTKCLKMLTEGAAGVTTHAQASGVSLNSDGFTINWDTVDATARIFSWCAIAAKPIYLSSFPRAPGMYHLASREWTFDASAQGWTGGTWDASKGRSGGGLYASCTSLGKGCTSGMTLEWAGTFESFGVPAGATVEYAIIGSHAGIATGVDARGFGDSKSITQYTLRDQFGALLQNILGSTTLSDTYRTYLGPDESVIPLPSPPLLLPSSTPIILRVATTATKNAGGIGVAETNVDNIRVVVKYRS